MSIKFLFCYRMLFSDIAISPVFAVVYIRMLLCNRLFIYILKYNNKAISYYSIVV